MSKRADLDDLIRDEFRRRGFCGLYVGGYTELVPRKLGDNLGGRPIKLGITRSLDDTISSHIDGASPYYEQKVLFRVWVQTFPVARKLERLIIEALAIDAEGLRKAYWDMGPDFQKEHFLAEIQFIALANNIATWTEQEMISDLAMAVKDRFRKKGKVDA